MLSLMDSAVDYFTQIPPEEIWAHFIRGVSIAQIWAILVLAQQTRGVPVSTGIMPIKARFDRYRADFPMPQRFFYYPSYLHFYHEDWFLPFLLYASALVGGSLVFTGLHSRLGIFLCWSVYLSYANVMNFMYPWKVLILETGFLTMFLPCLQMGWLTPLEHAANPLLLFSLRYLIFRLMFGFGKFKFIGMKLHDLSYLKGFLINQPLPTIFGWLMHQLPLPIHVASYVFLFLAEIPGPFLYFFCGTPRFIGFILVNMLQVGIIATGTFGFFNLLTSILSICLLDLNSSLLDDFSFQTDFFATFGTGVINCFLVFLLLLHCVFIPFNNWCSMAFLYWPGLNIPASWIGHFLRFLLPWHISHAYGVFFPHSSPPLKFIPIIEGTDEEVIDPSATAEEQEEARAAGGVEEKDAKWETYTYKYILSNPYLTPKFVAPYHPLMEHAILYEALGLGPQTLLAPVTTGDPYEFQKKHMLETVCHGLMRENDDVEQLFRAVPFGRRSPSQQRVRALRVSIYLFKPTTIGTLLRTGRWYDRWYSHVHVPLLTLRGVEAGRQGIVRLREPEMFHPEMYLWQLRAPAVQRLLAKLDQPTKPLTSLLAAHTPEEQAELRRLPKPSDTNVYTFARQILIDRDVEEFWTKFVEPLQPWLNKVRLPVGHQPDPSANGSRKVGLESSQLAEPKNRPFLVDQPWNVNDRSHWSRVVTDANLNGPSSKWSPVKKECHEKVLARLTLLMLKRILPFYHGPDSGEPVRTAWSDMHGETEISARMSCTGASHLHLPSFFHLYLFCHHIINKGRSAYEAVLNAPETAVTLLESYCLESCLFFFGIFHNDILAFQSRKRRLISVFSHPSGMVAGGVLPGALSIYYNFLGSQFPPRDDYPESFPKLEEPKSACSGWTVTIGKMPTYSPGRQDKDTMENSKKMN